MAVLGKTNGRKMEYTSTAGTEEEEAEEEEEGEEDEEGQRSDAFSQIPLSHGERRFSFFK